MTSDTMDGINEVSLRTFSSSPGFSLKKMTPPVIELRVVSLPPTISNIKLPINMTGSLIRSLVLGSFCIKRIRSNDSTPSSKRSCHNFEKLSKISTAINLRSSSVKSALPVIRSSDTAASDHIDNLCRSSHGKSNSVASI